MALQHLVNLHPIHRALVLHRDHLIQLCRDLAAQPTATMTHEHQSPGSNWQGQYPEAREQRIVFLINEKRLGSTESIIAWVTKLNHYKRARFSWRNSRQVWHQANTPEFDILIGVLW